MRSFGRMLGVVVLAGCAVGMLLFIPYLSPYVGARGGEVPFGTRTVIAAYADGARSVCAADVDGDGDVDVLSASQNDDRIVWYENNGGGGGSPPAFTGHTITTRADGAFAVYAADIDSDGDVDVLSASLDDDTIAWYENDGGASPFFTRRVIAADADHARSVYAADVDGDGDLDVLSASSWDDTVAWYENEGGSPPAFAAHAITAAADGAHAVYAADVDGDGDLDVLSASWQDDTVAWYENDGGSSPGFTAHVIAVDADGAYAVYAADVDGDVDVLSASENDDTVAWYENDGHPAPGFTAHTITTNARGAMAVYAADVDGDGDLDILSASEQDDTIAWYENDGGVAGPPTLTRRVITAAADGAQSVCAADVDGDGDLDVLSASQFDDRIAWYPNQTIHRSAYYPAWAPIAGADGAQSVYAADVDGDGDLDILSASQDDDRIAWHENGGGSFPAFTTRAIAAYADGARSVYAADVDGDGDVDVLSASQNDDRIVWYENNGGGGGSPPAFTAHTITTRADGAFAVYAADIDGDGDVDVLSASLDDDTIAWYENDGGASPFFTRRVIAADADYVRSVYAADVDGDGDLDVLSASSWDDTVAWYENEGGSPPAFAAHAITTAADGAHAVYAADVDGDGDVDVLSASWQDDTVAWYENDGGSSPGFTAHVIAVDADGAYAVYAADVDGDGDVDVLSASENDDTVAWYENAGSAGGGSPPDFHSHAVTTGAGGALGVYAADVNGDGDLDVLLAAERDDQVLWYENRGGQFALATTDTAPASIVSGGQDDVLRVVAAPRGRSGDTDIELATLELLFEEQAGDPLTTAEANNLIERVHVYRDDGSGTFDPGTDVRVATVEALSLILGRQTVAVASLTGDGDLQVRVAYGSPATFFVVIELTHNAASRTPNRFRVTHLTDARGSEWVSTAEDCDHDLLLDLEHAPNVASGICVARGPGVEGDAYEPDDTCAQASSLVVGGPVQHHTFHQQADGDWAHFTASAGATYVLQATSTSARADLVLELYDACGGDLEGSDDNAFGADARILFTATAGGTYYLRASNHDAGAYGADVSYDLSVRVQAAGGVAVIVGGRNDMWGLQDNILYCTNAAYHTFLVGGLPKGNLRYLSAVDDDARTDADGDGVSDVYVLATSAGVEEAITGWAAGLLDEGMPFYLYMMDHGAVDVFLVAGDGDTVRADDLDDWLTDLEGRTGAAVNVFYEACHSGSFIDGVLEISRPGRVVIASTGRENNAYPSRDGAFFSDVFWTQVRQSVDLYTSFQVAKGAVEMTGLWQTPWLDDNGDGVPSSGDGDLARQRGLLNLSLGDRPPAIDWVRGPDGIVDGNGVLHAQVRDDGGGEVDVWAVVYPPSFQEPAPTADGTIPELGLPRVLLSDSDGDGEYVGVYEGFVEDGVYHVVVYARDGSDNHALPAVMTVQTRWWAYLPLALR